MLMLKLFALLSQTCWGFKELAEDCTGNHLEIGLSFRREGQIRLALKCIQKCAENGNAEAMFHLGEALFSSGLGLNFDNVRASEWFQKSAEGGHAPGMAFYAYCLSLGYGDEMNKEKSKVWGEKALSSNNAFATAYCHYQGLGGIPINGKKAFAYFEASAKEGDAYGQEWLADFYQFGEEVNQDFEKAFSLYLKAAEQGLSRAQFEVGTMLKEGLYCEKDVEKGFVWIKKAAKQGHKAAKDEVLRRECELNPVKKTFLQELKKTVPKK